MAIGIWHWIVNAFRKINRNCGHPTRSRTYPETSLRRTIPQDTPYGWVDSPPLDYSRHSPALHAGASVHRAACGGCRCTGTVCPARARRVFGQILNRKSWLPKSPIPARWRPCQETASRRIIQANVLPERAAMIPRWPNPDSARLTRLQNKM